MIPYDNEIVFLHEGASGSGKSEMLEYAHRSSDGRLKLGKNTVTGINFQNYVKIFLQTSKKIY